MAAPPATRAMQLPTSISYAGNRVKPAREDADAKQSLENPAPGAVAHFSPANSTSGPSSRPASRCSPLTRTQTGSTQTGSQTRRASGEGIDGAQAPTSA